MSIAALNNALSGLKTSQRALGVISDNIANANTEGYVRKVAEPSSIVLGNEGAGVEIGRISRVVDEYLLRERREEVGELKAVETLEIYFNEIQDLFGQPGDNNSIAALTERLQTAFQNFEVHPEDSFRARQVVDAAEELGARLEDMHYTLQNLRGRADNEIGDDVTQINTLLNQIDEFNVDIIRAEAKLQDGSGLRDKRDVALNRLSELVDITYWENSDGAVNVTTSAGMTLLDVDPLTVFHDTPNDLRSNIRYDEDRAINDPDLGTVHGIFVGSIDATTDITPDLRRGSIKGLVDVRDEIIPALVSEMDELARQLRDGVNAVHNLGAAFPPPSTLSGTRSFTDFTPNPEAPTQITAANQFFNGTGVIRVSLVQSNPPAQRGETVQTFTVDLDAERANAGGNISVDAVVAALNAELGANGTASFDPDGRLQIVSADPDVGVVIDAPLNLQTSNEIAAGAIGDLVAGFLGVNANDEIEVLASDQSSLGTITIGAATSLNDLAALINDTTNGIPGVTARVEVMPAGGSRLEVTADDGQSITFRDVAAGTSAATLGLTAAANSFNATEPSVAFAESKSFASAQESLSEIDGVRTSTAPQQMTITAGGTTITVGPITLTNTTETAAPAEDSSLAAISDAINLVGGADIQSRVVNVDGWKLEISASNGQPITFDGDLATTLGLKSQEFGFSHYFGLNDFFAYSDNFSAASDLQVRAGIANDPNLLVSADPNNSIETLAAATGNTASTAITSGNNGGAKALAEAMFAERTFTAAGDLPEISLSLPEYASRILSNQAIKASLNGDDLTFREDVVGELSFRIQGVSGVNIDEELSNLVLFQNAFTAAARVISASQELLDELVNITR